MTSFPSDYLTPPSHVDFPHVTAPPEEGDDRALVQNPIGPAPYYLELPEDFAHAWKPFTLCQYCTNKYDRDTNPTGHKCPAAQYLTGYSDNKSNAFPYQGGYSGAKHVIAWRHISEKLSWLGFVARGHLSGINTNGRTVINFTYEQSYIVDETSSSGPIKLLRGSNDPRERTTLDGDSVSFHRGCSVRHNTFSRLITGLDFSNLTGLTDSTFTVSTLDNLSVTAGDTVDLIMPLDIEKWPYPAPMITMAVKPKQVEDTLTGFAADATAGLGWVELFGHDGLSTRIADAFADDESQNLKGTFKLEMKTAGGWNDVTSSYISRVTHEHPSGTFRTRIGPWAGPEFTDLTAAGVTDIRVWYEPEVDATDND